MHRSTFVPMEKLSGGRHLTAVLERSFSCSEDQLQQEFVGNILFTLPELWKGLAPSNWLQPLQTGPPGLLITGPISTSRTHRRHYRDMPQNEELSNSHSHGMETGDEKGRRFELSKPPALLGITPTELNIIVIFTRACVTDGACAAT
ncbi:unnamed protein product [Tuber melanosporum]|uniref:(Perigord truffle) hypothetical protein n=1 Tax=Tuber melanosporum (strain Mel28) TaxID=656061 RepID=D5GG16_TUBMM|nr:uncharacterized protein GSTUM_00007155001 [Tuber melanosporum]CAZ83459.1 unnamed protein product [Tuber melanosporum]